VSEKMEREEFIKQWNSIDSGLKVVKLRSGDSIYTTNYEVMETVDIVKKKHELFINLIKDVAGIRVDCATVKLKNIKEVE
jgi:precorrin-4 methylase